MSNCSHIYQNCLQISVIRCSCTSTRTSGKTKTARLCSIIWSWPILMIWVTQRRSLSFLIWNLKIWLLKLADQRRTPPKRQTKMPKKNRIVICLSSKMARMEAFKSTKAWTWRTLRTSPKKMSQTLKECLMELKLQDKNTCAGSVGIVQVVIGFQWIQILST